MKDYFQKTSEYLEDLDLGAADALDKKAHELLKEPDVYERASQSLRRRFSRGASEVEGEDRGGKHTKIRREKVGGKYKYFVLGTGGDWTTPEERIWVVSMYALWQERKRKS